MEVPEDNKEYLQAEYWDKRYSEEQSYDWLLTYEKLAVHLQPLLHPDSRILVLGAGNSTLSGDLYAAGFSHITNIDISQVVVTRMAEQHADKPGMECTG